eukprot:209292-Pelagomonas_calceolata.AAC.5
MSGVSKRMDVSRLEVRNAIPEVGILSRCSACLSERQWVTSFKVKGDMPLHSHLQSPPYSSDCILGKIQQNVPSA